MQSAVRASHCSHAACYSMWKKIKEQTQNNPARHREKLQPHHCSLTADLPERRECLHLHREAGNAKQPLFLLAAVLCTPCSELPQNPAQQHCWATPAQGGQKSQNSRKVWLEKKPRKYMSLWTLISLHSLFSSVLLSPIIKIKWHLVLLPC